MRRLSLLLTVLICAVVMEALMAVSGGGGTTTPTPTKKKSNIPLGWTGVNPLGGSGANAPTSRPGPTRDQDDAVQTPSQSNVRSPYGDPQRKPGGYAADHQPESTIPSPTKYVPPAPFSAEWKNTLVKRFSDTINNSPYFGPGMGLGNEQPMITFPSLMNPEEEPVPYNEDAHPEYYQLSNMMFNNPMAGLPPTTETDTPTYYGGFGSRYRGWGRGGGYDGGGGGYNPWSQLLAELGLYSWNID